MPIIPSQFQPPALLRNGHVQTILAAVLPRWVDLPFERERWELPDGDFLDVDWARSGHKRVAILTHGLDGSSMDNCVRGMASALADAGWDALAWNFRGCGGEPNRLLRFYHGGETDDLATVIEQAATAYSQIALIGFSLGGNVTLKYLGEGRTHPAVAAGVGISVPVDLAASGRALDRRWANRIYTRRLVKRLVTMLEAKAGQYPRHIDVAGARAIRSFVEFDGRYTAPLHGFRDAADYWARSSARQFLPWITVPALLLNARNDPFLAPECFPAAEAEANPAFFLEAPESGGHVGFLNHRLHPWSEGRVVEFLAGVTATEPASDTASRDYFSPKRSSSAAAASGESEA
jgi:predicted alpha/beta-fold hydrolase